MLVAEQMTENKYGGFVNVTPACYGRTPTGRICKRKPLTDFYFQYGSYLVLYCNNHALKCIKAQEVL